MPPERCADWLRPDFNTPASGASSHPGAVGALMSTRAGGVSRAPFDSMNLGSAVGDDPPAVAQNRTRFAQAMNAVPVFMRQVHGARVVRLTQADARPGAPTLDADGCVTTERGLACVIQVADCLPVLFAAPNARAVGAAHAGWRGLAAGVLQNTLAQLCAAAGCDAAEVRAWLGPCIGPRQFQVGSMVLDAFGAGGAGVADGADGPWVGLGGERFVPQSDGKWLADLAGLAADVLRAQGVRHIGGPSLNAAPSPAECADSSASACTVENASRFFSFRRDGATGRMAAAIWLNRSD